MAGKRTYTVTLTDEERDQLHAMLSSGKAAARKLNHARLLLYADEATDGWWRTDPEIAATLRIVPRTVERVRQRFVEEGLDAALVPRPRGAYKVDPCVEAQILAIAKSDPPSGCKRWTLRLIADRLVALNRSAVSPRDGAAGIKKTPSSRGRRRPGAFLPRRMPSSWPEWRICWSCISCPTIRDSPWWAWMRCPSN